MSLESESSEHTHKKYVTRKASNSKHHKLQQLEGTSNGVSHCRPVKLYIYVWHKKVFINISISALRGTKVLRVVKTFCFCNINMRIASTSEYIMLLCVCVLLHQYTAMLPPNWGCKASERQTGCHTTTSTAAFAKNAVLGAIVYVKRKIIQRFSYRGAQSAPHASVQRSYICLLLFIHV